MEREVVGLQEAADRWGVSPDVLTRRLDAGDAPDAEQGNDGAWSIPVEWLDDEFGQQVIDLRDPQVSAGLAAILTEITSMGEKLTAAEVKAAVAENDRDRAEAKLRDVSSELDDERAQHQRLHEDYIALERELAITTDRVERLEHEASQAWQAWQDAEGTTSRELDEAQGIIDRLSTQLDRQQHKAQLLESVTMGWQRRRFRALLEEFDNEAG